MRRAVQYSVLVVALAASLCVAGCGGSATRTRTVTVPAAGGSSSGVRGEFLAVPAVGRFYGRCGTSAVWKITFVNDSTASDGVDYRIGSGRRRSVQVDPGRSLTLKLARGRFVSREPADPTGRFPAQTIKTTLPVVMYITQGTEPHIFHVKVRFAIAPAIGDTADCALIASTVNAGTYYNGPPN